jgi:predicted nuclease of predicted toxin-antitoxin system
VKLLLDENLSPWVAQRLAREDHLDACGVRDRGMLNVPDHGVIELAYREDRIFVTSNVADFRKLARARELHPGIVLIEEGSLSRQEQLDRVRIAIQRIRDESDVVNKLVTVWPDGSTTVEVVPPEA